MGPDKRQESQREGRKAGVRGNRDEEIAAYLCIVVRIATAIDIGIYN